ncbi:MAG TPA: hypothetical protein VEH07_05800 [Alphaproteobacteria bacterium]|nr:hypothetical protein [Alphaproteobacteria bacterium]
MAEVYFEFTYQGTYVKVAAIDAGTGLEVSIVGPISTPQWELEKLALQKLEYLQRRLEKRAPKAP